MRILFVIFALTNVFALGSPMVTKLFSFHKKTPNTTPNSFKSTSTVNLSSFILSLTIDKYFDFLSQRREGDGKLKKVREQAGLKFKKFLNSKSLTKNVYNMCWSNPCKNNAKCYGSVSKFKCNEIKLNINYQ
jgi:hypothetical protein